MATTRFAQIVLIFPCLFSVGLAIHCFQCNSEENPECVDLAEDNENSTFYKNCTGDYFEQVPFCRKVYSRNMNTDEERVYRGCGWIIKGVADRKDSCRKVDNGFLQRYNCACFKEGCNAAEDIRSVPTILTMTSIFVVLSNLFHIC